MEPDESDSAPAGNQEEAAIDAAAPETAPGAKGTASAAPVSAASAPMVQTPAAAVGPAAPVAPAAVPPPPASTTLTLSLNNPARQARSEAAAAAAAALAPVPVPAPAPAPAAPPAAPAAEPVRNAAPEGGSARPGQPPPVDAVEARLRDSARGCLVAYRSWRQGPGEATIQNLNDAVHELRRVLARIEIDMSASRRDEQAVRPIPVPAHRAARPSR
jgi:hypothetical protein